MSTEPATERPPSRQFAFLPWLRLKEPYRVGGVEFLPFRDKSCAVLPALAEAASALDAILCGYRDRKGKPIDNCVVATIGTRWNVADSEFESVTWAASLLFLATWASNAYYPKFGGPYVNSTAFRPVWQRFSGTPTWIALTSRRRNGRNLDGGYKHGEVTFTLPTQCHIREPVVVDQAFLAGLASAWATESRTAQALLSALPFVALANTDDDLMSETAEAVLMGSALEQLFRGDGSAYKLCRQFRAVFNPYGSVRVAEAKATRPGIRIGDTKPEFAKAQPKWWVHQKWIEELYDLRSKSVHEGTARSKNWGWHPAEHLVMAAWVFPLAVKLLLQREGHYRLNDDDTVKCLAVDKLLAATDWADDVAHRGTSQWHHIVATARSQLAFERVAGKLGITP